MIMAMRRNIVVGDDAWAALKAIAEFKEKSVSDILRGLIADYVKKEESSNLSLALMKMDSVSDAENEELKKKLAKIVASGDAQVEYRLEI